MKTAKNLILLALITVAVSCAAMSDDLIKLVMPEAKVVSGINITTARNTPFGQFVISQMQKEEKGLQELYNATGFDPRRDVDQIMLATSDPQKKHTGVVLVYGRFDVTRITAALKTKAGSAAVSKYRGFDVISSSKPTDNGTLAFLPGGVAVAGDKASVYAALDRAGTSAKADPALRDRIQNLSNSYDAWFFSDLPASSMTGMLPTPKMGGQNNPNAPNANVLQSVQQTSGGVRFGSNVEVHAEAITRSDKDATALMNVLQFLASMVQMNRDKPGADKAAGVLDSMVVRTKGPAMTLDLIVPQADIEKMFKEHENHQKAPARKTART